MHVRSGFSAELGGTFAEYCVADAEIIISISEHVKFEDAAGIGLCGFTACQALWQHGQGLPTPEAPTQGASYVRPYVTDGGTSG